MPTLENGRLPVGSKGLAFLRVFGGTPRDVELMMPTLKDSALATIEQVYRVRLNVFDPIWRQYAARPRVETVYIDGKPYPQYFPAPVLPFACEVVSFNFL